METDNPVYDFESGGFSILSQGDGPGNLAVQGTVFTDRLSSNTHSGNISIKSNTIFDTGVTLNMNGNIVSNLGTPIAPSDASNREYTDLVTTNAINGLFVKDPVEIATITSGNILTSFSAGQSVDSVTLVAGMRILIKNQTVATEKWNIHCEWKWCSNAS